MTFVYFFIRKYTNPFSLFFRNPLVPMSLVTVSVGIGFIYIRDSFCADRVNQIIMLLLMKYHPLPARKI